MAFDTNKSFEPYIYRIAANVASTAWRRRGADLARMPLDPEQVTAAEKGGNLEEVDQLRHCLRKLSTKDLLVLAMWEGALGDLKQMEVAAELGVSESKLSRHKHRILKTLQRLMNG